MWLATLCYPMRSKEVLLIYKRRGFGAGKYNGVGGKIEPNEDIWQGVKREVREEVGLELLEVSYKGVLVFYAENEVPDIVVHVFTSRKFKGEPSPSEEALPQWFGIDQIPYDSMWEDDKIWLPHVLNGKNIYGQFWFKRDYSKMLKYNLSVYYHSS
ncbi:MAG: 8-oxo-dGTP diphosphatase [Thermofilum sp.]|nr:8-oxo-dGTP diphosphatase [Thermofilum sp.]